MPLPPGLAGWGAVVGRVESLRGDMPVRLAGGGSFTGYREFLEGEFETLDLTEDGAPAIVKHLNLLYICGWCDAEAMARVLAMAAEMAGLEVLAMPEGVRRRETAGECFWFNHSLMDAEVAGLHLPALSVTRVSG